jgi:hypothetical protein
MLLLIDADRKISADQSARCCCCSLILSAYRIVLMLASVVPRLPSHTSEDMCYDGLAGASDQYNGRYVVVVSEIAGAHTQHSLNEHTVFVTRAK